MFNAGDIVVLTDKMKTKLYWWQWHQETFKVESIVNKGNDVNVVHLTSLSDGWKCAIPVNGVQLARPRILVSFEDML